ncbi:DUF2235 domain-containing protein [Oerskovia sp. M15]
MKRLVLCCDGTWNSPVRASVSNIEKIARSVHTGIGPDGVQQMVFSVEESVPVATASTRSSAGRSATGSAATSSPDTGTSH